MTSATVCQSIRMRAVTTAALVVTVAMLSRHRTAAGADELADLRTAFEQRTGAMLVFTRTALAGDDAWYDRMPALARARRIDAARILVAESAKYPAGWLGAIGLKQVGVFDALVSDRGDGYRPYDEDAKGYLYYGMWNGRDSVIAAYYTDGQLPLTFHHEIFHHVDATDGGKTAHTASFTSDDDAYTAAVEGTRRYPALRLRAADLRALARKAGAPLTGAVSDYAAKSPSEDQAETARWLMSHLATGLWQAAERPELAGSQRILHVLDAYRAAGKGFKRGPDVEHLLDVALGRAAAVPANSHLRKVDEEIRDRAWRASIRAVQPAVVRLGGGTGVNLAAGGTILTAAHVVDEEGPYEVIFPDGRTFDGTVAAIDHVLDLAVVTLDGPANRLPFAPVAAAAPASGSAVAIVGHPGRNTPDGEATGYQPWNVSTGVIRGFRSGARTGDQGLGRTKHDAWTYWGHSGSPLFDRTGAIVALHNSWDSKTAMRHAVTWEAIVTFLDGAGVSYIRP
jgi:S1-C subfamily serine protease